MSSISLGELKEKLDAGQSIEEIAKDYLVYFDYKEEYIPENISVEQLIEIIEKAPELLTRGEKIPVWAFLLLLVREKFDIVDNIVSSIFEKNKRILPGPIKKNISDTVCNTLSVLKQVSKEQILMLYFIMEKRRNLIPNTSKDNVACLLIERFFVPFKDYLDEEQFLFLFDWVSKETNSYFFREISSKFFDKFPVENQLVQEKLVKYFISAPANWLVRPKQDKFDLFKKINKVKLLNEAFFVSSVVKSYFKLQDAKKVYLLNFPYFIENYPQLAVNSLRAFINNKYGYADFLLEDNNIFITNKILDIIVKKDPIFLNDIIAELPIETFSFDVSYIYDKANILCFIKPENALKIKKRLKTIKGLLVETPIFDILKEINNKADIIRSKVNPQQMIDIIEFIFNKLPYDIASYVLYSVIPHVNSVTALGPEELEYELGPVKTQLQEMLSYLKEVNQTIRDKGQKGGENGSY